MIKNRDHAYGDENPVGAIAGLYMNQKTRYFRSSVVGQAHSGSALKSYEYWKAVLPPGIVSPCKRKRSGIEYSVLPKV